ncbi:MAG: hypothetical protein ACYDH6_04745 [Acidimicrobiales bacterium]
MRSGVVALLVVCAACASGHPALTTDASTQLSTAVAAVRSDIGLGDLAGARQQLATLRQTVARLEQQGQLSSSRAAAVLSAADDVARQLQSVTTTTSTTEPPPSTESPGRKKKDAGD